MGTPTQSGRRCSMMKAALSEAGWPQADVFVEKGVVSFWTRGVPNEVIWRASVFVAQAEHIPAPCWPCWQAAGCTQSGRPERGCPHYVWDGAPPAVAAGPATVARAALDALQDRIEEAAP